MMISLFKQKYLHFLFLFIGEHLTAWKCVNNNTDNPAHQKDKTRGVKSLVNKWGEQKGLGDHLVN